MEVDASAELAGPFVRALECTLGLECFVTLEGRRAPSCVDADETWSAKGSLSVMAAALPARAGLRYLLTAVRQALKHRSCGVDRPGLFPNPVFTVSFPTVGRSSHGA